jgi:hypothetical protein
LFFSENNLLKEYYWLGNPDDNCQEKKAEGLFTQHVGGGFPTAVPHTSPVSKLAKPRLRRETLILGPSKMK